MSLVKPSEPGANSAKRPEEARTRPLFAWCDNIIPTLSDSPTHPLQIALRTYALALSLSLGPAMVLLLRPLFQRKTPRGRGSRPWTRLFAHLLKRELGVTGFACSFVVAVAGGAAIQHCWKSLEEYSDQERLPPASEIPTAVKALNAIRAWLVAIPSTHKTFIANLISSIMAARLLRVGSPPKLQYNKAVTIPGALTISDPRLGEASRSSTWEVTLLLVVRAFDVAVQYIVSSTSDRIPRNPLEHERKEVQGGILRETLRNEMKKQEIDVRRWRLITAIDSLVFWGCSARVMWCYFYEPERLPKSYVRWIGTLAHVDPRLLQTLRALRSGSWQYSTASLSSSHLLNLYATDLGYPAAWGNSALLPAFGREADLVWRSLRVVGRKGVAGLPCELVHGTVGVRGGFGNSCVLNAASRFTMTALEAIAIYFPVHFLPVLLTRPRAVFRARTAIATMLAALRSAGFLSTFVASFWMAVCTTRTLLLARLMPQVSHNFWDGPYGCVLAGCLTCGSSIWIENERRRGEMALYVLPMAIQTLLPKPWGSGNRVIRLLEQLAFVTSLASLLTAAVHRQDTLRGLSRWTLAFVTDGPTTGFWKQKLRSLHSIPPTPSIPASQQIRSDDNSHLLSKTSNSLQQ